MNYMGKKAAAWETRRRICGGVMMNRETRGKVIAVKKQWWLKVNTKPVRSGTMDGAIFPYVIKAEYTVNGQVYVKRKWIRAGRTIPEPGSPVTVSYEESKPSRARVI